MKMEIKRNKLRGKKERLFKGLSRQDYWSSIILCRMKQLIYKWLRY